jgi:hypothetical protein
VTAPEPCPRCGEMIRPHVLTRHQSGRHCAARMFANIIRERGLVPVTKPVFARVIEAEAALAMFGYPCEIHPTRTKTTHGDYRASGNQAWTSPAGFELLTAIEATATLLALSFPEAARRLREHMSVIGPFDTARRLGADDASLRALLGKIDYVIGSDGKRRPRVKEFYWPPRRGTQ